MRNLLAPSEEYYIPHDLPGAKECGITCDDFIRLKNPPETTLIVGSTPEGLECASILAGFQLSVFVVVRFTKRFPRLLLLFSIKYIYFNINAFDLLL